MKPLTHTILLRALLLLLLLCPCALADDAAAAPTSDPHQQLNQILNQPIYNRWRLRQSEDPTANDITLARLSQRLGDEIDRFWNWLFPPRKQSPTTMRSAGKTTVLPTLLESTAWVAAATAVIFIIVLVVKSLGPRPTPSTGRILSRQQIQDALNSGNALALDADQWLDQVQRLAAEQNFRAVYRALYLALLSGLHTAGKIDHGRNRTNWAYVRQFRGPDDQRLIFGDLTDLFDRVWYGRKSEPHRDIGQLRATVASLIAVADAAAVGGQS